MKNLITNSSARIAVSFICLIVLIVAREFSHAGLTELLSGGMRSYSGKTSFLGYGFKSYITAILIIHLLTLIPSFKKWKVKNIISLDGLVTLIAVTVAPLFIYPIVRIVAEGYLGTAQEAGFTIPGLFFFFMAGVVVFVGTVNVGSRYGSINGFLIALFAWQLKWLALELTNFVRAVAEGYSHPFTAFLILGGVFIMMLIALFLTFFKQNYTLKSQYGDVKIPLRVNPLGVLPIIIASFFMMLSMVLYNFFPESDIVAEIFRLIRPGTFLYGFFITVHIVIASLVMAFLFYSPKKFEEITTQWGYSWDEKMSLTSHYWIRIAINVLVLVVLAPMPFLAMGLLHSTMFFGISQATFLVLPIAIVVERILNKPGGKVVLKDPVALISCDTQLEAILCCNRLKSEGILSSKLDTRGVSAIGTLAAWETIPARSNFFTTPQHLGGGELVVTVERDDLDRAMKLVEDIISK